MFCEPYLQRNQGCGRIVSVHSRGELTDLNHIGSHLPALQVGVVDDDGVSASFKSLFGYKEQKEKQHLKSEFTYESINYKTLCVCVCLPR